MSELFFARRFNTGNARKLQIRLSEKVIQKDCFSEPIQYVGGVDIAYDGKESIGAVAVFEYEQMKLVETATSRQTTTIPYIPTFLSFREIPPTVSAFKKLQRTPDVVLVDGQGIAHPRRLGFASHLGLVLDMPTIGVAKSVLCGEVRDNGGKRWKPLVYKGNVIGAAVETRSHVKPVYVSVGHKVSLESAIKIVLHCARGYRIPEPLREAHKEAERGKRGKS